MKNVINLGLIVWVFIGATAATPSVAQEADALKKIRDTNTITIGHRDTATPFSYFDAKKQPIGYSIDLCMKIVDAVKITQNLPELEVEFVLVSGTTRIPMVANGTDSPCSCIPSSMPPKLSARA